jgi:hypothetical protein
VETPTFQEAVHQRIVRKDYKQIDFAVNYQVGCLVAVE